MMFGFMSGPKKLPTGRTGNSNVTATCHVSTRHTEWKNVGITGTSDPFKVGNSVGYMTAVKSGTPWITANATKEEDALQLRSVPLAGGFVLQDAKTNKVITLSGHWLVLTEYDPSTWYNSVLMVKDTETWGYWAHFAGNGTWLCVNENGELNAKDSGEWVTLHHWCLGDK
jgi:hypothetical protein